MPARMPSVAPSDFRKLSFLQWHFYCVRLKKKKKLFWYFYLIYSLCFCSIGMLYFVVFSSFPSNPNAVNFTHTIRGIPGYSTKTRPGRFLCITQKQKFPPFYYSDFKNLHFDNKHNPRKKYKFDQKKNEQRVKFLSTQMLPIKNRWTRGEYYWIPFCCFAAGHQ